MAAQLPHVSKRAQWSSGPMGFASRTRHDGAMAYESTQTGVRPEVGILLTEVGLRAREEELDQLRAAKRNDIGGRLRDARGYGEPGGNDEYLATREDEAIIDARIAASRGRRARVARDRRRRRVRSRRALSPRRITRGAGPRRRLDQLTGRPGTAGTPGGRDRRRKPSRRSHAQAADRLHYAADVGNWLAAALRSR